MLDLLLFGGIALLFFMPGVGIVCIFMALVIATIEEKPW